MTYLIKNIDDVANYLGRNGLTFPFDRIENDFVFLKNGKIEYKIEIPKNWTDAELLEPGCQVQIIAESRKVIPKIYDAITNYFTINQSEIEILVPWRGRYYLFAQHAPEPYYTVYSLNITNYPNINGQDVTGKLIPHRKLGYAPLKNKKDPELDQYFIRAVPCMTN